MKIFHVVGARPNFMKVTPVMAALNRCDGIDQTLIHTGQHYDNNMSDIFFSELGLPRPDINLEVGSNTHSVQTAHIMMRLEKYLLSHGPDIVLVYGDVNSTVAAALVCSKLMIPLGHVEAGLRSFDRTMPEEINRILTDQVADLLFTPSKDGDENLLREGIAREKVCFVGNVMIDVLTGQLPRLNMRPELRVKREHDSYALVTLHRPSNVDSPEGLADIMNTLHEMSEEIPIIFPIHPRTRQRLAGSTDRVSTNGRLHLIDPVGYLDFLSLQRDARVVVTDSGGIQEETTFLGVPCLTIRNNTERPVTVDIGTNILVGSDMRRLKEEVEKIIKGEGKKGSIPPLWDGKAGERIANIINEWSAENIR